MSHTGDIREEAGNDIPSLAKMLYHDYATAALQLADEAIGKTLDSIPELFPSIDKEGAEALRQVLLLERIVKFCQVAENLGAFAVAFKSSFDDEKHEIRGIFQTITSYSVGDVVNFYKEIKDRNLQYIAKFAGYPTLRLQRPSAKRTLETTCRNIRDDMAKIGILYDELRLLYDAYKHGYRVAFGKDNNTHDDVIVYIDKNKNQKVFLLTKALLKDITDNSAVCFHILDVILKTHQARVKFEATGLRAGPVIITIYRRKTDPRPTQNDLQLLYPNRGQRLKQEAEDADKVYEEFKDDLEKEHLGKFVAIDIDERKVISIDSNMEKVRADVHKWPYAGRIRIRKIGKNARTGLDIY